MEFDLTLQSGSRVSRNRLELVSAPGHDAIGGRISFALDAEPRVTRSSDWAEIAPGVYSIIIEGRSYQAEVLPDQSPVPGAVRCTVVVGRRAFQIELRDPRARRRSAAMEHREGPKEILAPMPGRIVKVLVKCNQKVEPGQGLLVIEAMKMQNELRAPRAGRVEEIYVGEGAGVESGSKLVRLA